MSKSFVEKLSLDTNSSNTLFKSFTLNLEKQLILIRFIYIRILQRPKKCSYTLQYPLKGKLL